MTAPWMVAFILVTLVVLLVALLVLGLTHRVLDRLQELEARAEPASPDAQTIGGGPLVGETAPPLPLPEEIVSADHRVTEPMVVLFLETNCEACRVLASDLCRHRFRVQTASLVIVTDNAELVPPHCVEGILVHDRSREIIRSWGLSGTPSGFVVDRYGFVLARAFPNTVRDLHELVRQSLSISARATRRIPSPPIKRQLERSNDEQY